MRKLCIAYLFIIFNFSQLKSEITINIDTTINYQTITGWEATTFIASPCEDNFEPLRDLLLPLLVDSIGITRIRLEVKSGVENNKDYYQAFIRDGCPKSPDTNYTKWRESRYATVNDNNDTTINWDGFHFTELDWNVENIVLPLKEYLENKGEKLYINVNYVAFTSQIKNGDYIHDDPDEYAEFVLATYIYMYNKYRLIPDSWEILLEPDNVREWNGSIMGKALAKSSERLIANGFQPHFVAPSTTNMTNAITYFTEIVKIPGAIEYLDEISYHRYSGVSSNSLKSIASLAKQYGKNTAMLEWWFDNSTYKVLHEDLSTGNNSCFQQAVINGFFDIDITNREKPTAKIKDISQYNRLYYLFIRPGAKRKEASSDNITVSPLVFKNSRSDYTVLVKSDTIANITIKGLPNGNYGVKYTSTINKFTDGADIESNLNDAINVNVNKGVTCIYKKSVGTEAINRLSEKEFISIKPDLASEFIEISMGLLQAETVQKIRIYNTIGECVINVSAQQTMAQQRIDISHLPIGLYFIKFGNYSEKFMVVR